MAIVAAGLAVLLAGCSTPGPLHLYSVAAIPDVVHDVAVQTDAANDIPAFVGPSERVVGFAYDPFTDHLFLRLAPGDRMRVIDRPARKIKREFVIQGVQGGSGDMAVRPRDGHVLLIDGAKAELLETTRLGAFVRRVPLARGSVPVAVAVDMRSEDLLVLEADGRTLRAYDATGHELSRVVLAATASPCLGYDADHGELYAPLADHPSVIGVFNRTGALVRRLSLAPGDTLIDAGPHAFFRMF